MYAANGGYLFFSFQRRRIACVCSGLGYGFNIALGVVEGDDGFALLEADLGLLDASDLGQGPLDRNRAHLAGHAWHRQGDGLGGSPGRSAQGGGQGEKGGEFFHGSLLSVEQRHDVGK